MLFCLRASAMMDRKRICASVAHCILSFFHVMDWRKIINSDAKSWKFLWFWVLGMKRRGKGCTGTASKICAPHAAKAFVVRSEIEDAPLLPKYSSSGNRFPSHRNNPCTAKATTTALSRRENLGQITCKALFVRNQSIGSCKWRNVNDQLESVVHLTVNLADRTLKSHRVSKDPLSCRKHHFQ